MSAPRPRHTSLYADAWRRLLRNRMAVFCGVVVLVQIVLVVLSGWIAPFAPDHQELWIGQQPPGFVHPDVKREMILTVGGPIDLPHGAAAAAVEHGNLLFEVRRASTHELRVVIRRNKVSSLTIDGGTHVTEVEVGPGADTRAHLEVLDPDRVVVRTVLEGRIEKGSPAPEWLMEQAAGRRSWVCLLEQVVAKELQIELQVKDGAIASLREAGIEQEELILTGREVQAVLAGGTEPVTHQHLLGTDDRGRDLLSRLLFGGWVSLLVGLVATLVSLAIGVAYGAISAYSGGKIDAAMMAFVDILYGVPYMFLVILLLVVFGRSIVMLFVALGCVQWLTMARIVRGQVLSLREQEFVEAARVSGGTRLGIIWRHLIPNTLGVVVVYATLTVPAVILQEAFLAFIGLNVEYQGKAIESWGAMVNAGRLALGNDGQNWWLLVFPALSLALLLFSLNFLGDGLRDAFDPRMRGRR